MPQKRRVVAKMGLGSLTFRDALDVTGRTDEQIKGMVSDWALKRLVLAWERVKDSQGNPIVLEDGSKKLRFSLSCPNPTFKVYQSETVTVPGNVLDGDMSVWLASWALKQAKLSWEEVQPV